MAILKNLIIELIIITSIFCSAIFLFCFYIFQLMTMNEEYINFMNDRSSSSPFGVQ